MFFTSIGTATAARRLLTGENGPLRKQILQLALPVVADQLLTTLTNIVDMMMVGRLGAASVAAIGLSNHPLFLSMAIFMGVGIGTTALVARHTGAGEPEAVESVTRQSFWMALAAAFAVAFAYYALAPHIMAIMGADAAVAPLGTAFLQWSAGGYVAMQWSQVMSGALRGRGDTLTPLYIGVGVNIVNVVLGYSLIYGHLGLPALGLIGSALGTTIARVAGALVLLAVLMRSQSPVRLQLRTLFRLDYPVMVRILRIGLPACGERAFQTLGMISFTRVIASLGTVSIAAHQIALNAESVSYMPANGLAAAGTALVGQRLGAGDGQGAVDVTRETVRIATVAMIVMSLVFLLLGKPYLSLYTGEASVRDLGVQMLMIAAAAQIPMGFAFVLSGALRGAGDTLYMMLITALGVWGVRLSITTALIAWAGWGLAAAWTAMFFDWVFRGLLAYRRYRSGVWRSLNL